MGRRFVNPQEANQHHAYTKGGRWRKVRAKKLRQNPVCENPFDIPDHIEAAREVHHKKPVRQFPELAFDMENLTSLCIPCHHRIHNER